MNQSKLRKEILKLCQGIVDSDGNDHDVSPMWIVEQLTALLDAPPEPAERMARVQNSISCPGPNQVPWWIAEKAYEGYSARYGTSQSLERLDQRGGFGTTELDMFFPGWREAIDYTKKLEAQISQLSEQVRELKDRAALVETGFDQLLYESRTVEIYNAVEHGAGGANEELRAYWREWEERPIAIPKGEK